MIKQTEQQRTDHQGGPWLTGRVPNGYWDTKANRLGYLRWLGQRLGYEKPDDWYAIGQKHFKQNHGGGLLNGFYKDSPRAALLELMPDQPWHPWLFNRTTKAFWQDIKNRFAFLQWLEQQLAIEQDEDWYRVTKKDFEQHGGLGLLHNYYDSSVPKAVKEFKPQMKLQMWKFTMAPQRFWSSRENCLRYMDWLSDQLKIRTPELWYGVTPGDVERNHGHTLLRMCGGSVPRLVAEFLPDYDWKPWLFQTAPNGHWDSLENRLTYLRWLGAQMGFKKPEEWYKLTHNDFRRTGGMGLFNGVYRNSLTRAARERYPDYQWEPKRFQYFFKRNLI